MPFYYLVIEWLKSNIGKPSLRSRVMTMVAVARPPRKTLHWSLPNLGDLRPARNPSIHAPIHRTRNHHFVFTPSSQSSEA